MRIATAEPPHQLWLPADTPDIGSGVWVLGPDTPVESADRVAMTLTDVVVDPIDHSATHLVVTPPGPHKIPRLVPVSSTRWIRDGLRLTQSDRGVRSLPRVLPSHFVRRPCDELELGAVTGFRTVLVHPFIPDLRSLTDASRGMDAHECSLRRGDDVISRDDRSVGQLHAFVVKRGRITALVVRPRVAGRKTSAIVPVELVSQHLPGMVILAANRNDLLHLGASERHSDRSVAHGFRSFIDSARRRASAVRAVR